jgi:hypothetical protein
MSPKKGAQYLQGIKRKLLFEIVKAEGQTGTLGVQIARKWSSGTATPATLAILGHPYGHGPRQFTAVNPALINKQTGLFYDSWTWKIASSGATTVLQIRNSAPYAQDLDLGTWKTIARPIRAQILKELLPMRRRNMQRALKRALGR